MRAEQIVGLTFFDKGVQIFAPVLSDEAILLSCFLSFLRCFLFRSVLSWGFLGLGWGLVDFAHVHDPFS
jgi:hypothetical protein